MERVVKIPAKIEYACRAILELALRYDNGNPVQVSAISKAQGIPSKFLVQLLLRLKNANLVSSSRGIAGGYSLNKPPDHISLADVFRAIDEGTIELPKLEKTAMNGSGRLFLQIWREVSQDIAKRLEETTIDQLATRLRNEELTYHI